MSISTLASLLAKTNAPTEQVYYAKPNIGTTQAGSLSSLFAASGNPGAGTTPTSSVACDSSSAGALAQRDSVSTTLRLMRCRYFAGGNTSSGPGPIPLVMYDRLNHSGGLSGTVTGAQTTGLPTAALTRYTNGLGVQAAIEIYSQVGTTATTLTCSYTNEAGTSGRSSDAIPFGGTGSREGGRFMPLSLQQGDLGIKSVESVTIAATTGTAGNFGVVFYRPLAVLYWGQNDYVADVVPILTCGGLGSEEILDGASLWFLSSTLQSTVGPWQCVFSFGED